jgi:hypothetical protein
MQRRFILCLPLLGAAGPARAQPVLPLPEAVALVGARYHGRMIDARLVPGREDERADLVYDLRWLTPAGDVLRIRVAAADGAMLLVEGPGMIAARR